MIDGRSRRRALAALLGVVAAALLLGGCARQDPDADGGAGVGPGPAPEAAAQPGTPGGQGNLRLRKSKLLGSAQQRFGGMGAAADGQGLLGRDVFDGDTRRYGSPTTVAANWQPAWGEPGDTTQQREALRDALTDVPSARGLRTVPVPPPAVAPSGGGADRPIDLHAASEASRLLGAGTALAAFANFQAKLEGEAVEAFSRQAWGARAARSAGVRQNPNRVTIHHTDGHPRTRLTDSIEEMRGYQKFHMQGRGWADIGYHFVIDGSGRVFEGRHAEILGAHAGGGNNWDNIGIAVMGDYNKDYLNDSQKNAMRKLITFLALRYHSDPRQRDFIQPHMHYKSTDCPGTHVVQFLATLRAGVTKDTLAYLDQEAPASRSFEPLALVTQ